MKQTVSVKELKSGGYTRFPRLFIDLLLQDYYPKNKTRLKIGVFIYIFGKLANKPTTIDTLAASGYLSTRGSASSISRPWPGHWDVPYTRRGKR